MVESSKDWTKDSKLKGAQLVRIATGKSALRIRPQPFGAIDLRAIEQKGKFKYIPLYYTPYAQFERKNA